jgi:hypothetical protein
LFRFFPASADDIWTNSISYIPDLFDNKEAQSKLEQGIFVPLTIFMIEINFIHLLAKEDREALNSWAQLEGGEVQVLVPFIELLVASEEHEVADFEDEAAFP